MTSMLKSAVVGAIAAAFVASVAVAQGQGPGMQGRGRGPAGVGGPGGRGPMPGVMQDLTEEQRAQVRTILGEQRKGQEGPPADARLRAALEAELLADVPDGQKIEDLKQQILQAQADGLSRHIAVQTRIAQVLTADQRAKARERLASGPGQTRGEGRPRRGGGRH